MSLAFKKNLKSIELKQNLCMNEQRERINKHEETVKKFMINMKRQEMQLHFAFLFACPLVLSCGEIDQEKYKLIPQLDY